MENKWSSVSIGELIDIGVITVHKDGNHGSNYPRAAEFGDEGVPFLTAKLVDDAGFIDLENAPRLNAEKASKITFGYLETDDVLLSHNATVGRVAIVPKLNEPVLIGTSLTHFRLDSTKLLPRYLATYFRGRAFQNQLSAVMSFSTRNQVPITAQRKLFVDLPPIYTQEKIAGILGALDEKIELNRQMNETLEAMAQALFKSWFVDFDPVIDNALAAGNEIPEPLKARAAARQALGDQRKPLPPEIQSQFPSSFVFTDEMGWIPEGWFVTPISDLCKTVQNGATPKRMEAAYWEHGTINWFKTGELNDSFLTSSEEKISELGLEKSSCKMWPAGTVLIAIYAAPTVGRLGILSENSCSNQACSGLVPLPEIGSHFIFQTLLEARKWLNTVAVGAAQQNISKAVVENVPALKVASGLYQEFDRLVGMYFSKINNQTREAELLSKLRDTLLPKLLSGELRVDTAEQPTSEAL